MPTIQIDALDTLFFRDSKTFTKGEDTWADTMFPPYPSVIYGALRSAYFAENIEELGKAAENDDPTKDLKINNIYLKQGEDLYFPYPMDCVENKETKDKEILEPKEKFLSGKHTNLNGMKDLLQSSFYTAETVKDSFVSSSSLKEYLTLEDKSPIAHKKSDFIELEPKIGIARSKQTRTSEEGMLYRVGMNRLESKLKENKTNKISLVVNFEGLKVKDGIMKMGGEGKAIRYETINDSIKIELPKISNGKFKLYLSTPAIFKKGWLPDSFDKNSLEGTINGVKVKLITAAIGKPVSIGGWDIKKGCPKTMRKAVPAGSVYYFKLTNPEDIDKLLSNCHGKSISDFNANEGFGIAYVGAINNA
jgi:CRISPR-associated protein Cmr3